MLTSSGFSQEWKSDEFMDDTTVRFFAHSERLKHVSLVNTRTSFWKKKKITTERRDRCLPSRRSASILFRTMRQNQSCRVGSRSFLEHGEVRKSQNNPQKKQQKDNEEHSVIWRMFMSSTLRGICINGEELLRQLAFH